MRCSLLLTALLLLLASPARATPSFRDIIQPHLDTHAIAGAVTLVADREGILAIEAFGLADRATGKAMTTDAMFWIASQTKPMTATAFMMLVDEGKVKVDDPVENYLPEFKGQMVIVEQDPQHMLLKAPGRPLAVRDVLSHTGGLRYSSPLEQPTLDRLRLADAVRSHALQPLLWEPGSKYLYSSAGINIAGRIIEVVTGMPYEDFMRTRLFEPLEMKDTTFHPTMAQVQRLATAYGPNADKSDIEETTTDLLSYPLTDPLRQPIPGGGLFSTATDLARFYRMILNQGELDGRRYLTAESVRKMTSKQTGDAIEDGYGFGWMTKDGAFGHSGSLNTQSSIDTATGLLTVLLVQQKRFIANGTNLKGDFKRAAKARFAGPPAPPPNR